MSAASDIVPRPETRDPFTRFELIPSVLADSISDLRPPTVACTPVQCGVRTFAGSNFPASERSPHYTPRLGSTCTRSDTRSPHAEHSRAGGQLWDDDIGSLSVLSKASAGSAAALAADGLGDPLASQDIDRDLPVSSLQSDLSPPCAVSGIFCRPSSSHLLPPPGAFPGILVVPLNILFCSACGYDASSQLACYAS